MVLEAIENKKSSNKMPKTPATKQQGQKSTPASDARQRTLFGFFQKATPTTPATPSQQVANTPTASSSPVESKVSKLALSTSSPQKSEFEESSSEVMHDMELDVKVAKQPPNLSSDSNNNVSRSGRSKRRVIYTESDDEDAAVISKSSPRVKISFSQPGSSAKKRRIAKDDDFEISDGEALSSDDYRSNKSESVELDDDDDFIDDDEGLAQPKRKAKLKASAKRTIATPSKTSSSQYRSSSPLSSPSTRLAAFRSGSASDTSFKRSPSLNPAAGKFKQTERTPYSKGKNEERWEWLEHKRDKDGNTPDSPDYNPATLLIPQHAWAKFTPFEKQYWEIKSEHMDKVLFFAKGSFAEQYSEDAYLMHQVFDLKLTERVNMPMTGVPDTQIDIWAAKLLAHGYKVARVDQTETALGKAMREAQGKQKVKDKIIRRELTGIYTAGTLVDGHLLRDDMASYCLALKEICETNGTPRFGIAFVDTSTSTFQIAEFEDDVQRTKLETLLLQTRVAEVLIEKNALTRKTLRVLKNSVSAKCLWNHLKAGTEFWDAETTAYELKDGSYFKTEGSQSTLQGVLSTLADQPLASSALGAVIWYLRRIKLDDELVSLGNVSKYDPLQQKTSLLLDGQTLANLEIFANSSTGTEDGTVVKLLNQCITPYGKRLFKIWLCHPLYQKERIDERLMTVDDFVQRTDLYDFRDKFEATFTRALDLERLISAIHGQRCKVRDFVKVLDAFGSIVQFQQDVLPMLDAFQSARIPNLLRSIPNLAPHLDFFKNAFDRQAVEKEGNMLPFSGIEEEVDDSLAEMASIESELEDMLSQYKKQLKCSGATFKDIGKEIYQVEVPSNVKVPGNWTKVSGTQKVNRYYNAELQPVVRRLQEARETHGSVVKDFESKMYSRFDENHVEWSNAVKIVAEVDCLLSLARSSLNLGQPSCRPQFVDSPTGFVEFKELRHPCVMPSVSTDFIPNDVQLGEEEASTMLLTGPNMAGKSTFLRMTCIAVIMAQLGCYVPCSSARLTPIDRIMSRLGANDNIFASQSTFMVELNETSKIMREATDRSLVIVDELGRGTNTLQGYAIAYAVLDYLTNNVKCLTAFATHYHQLAEEFTRDKTVALRNMLCQVEDKRQVTFLYKLVEGVAPKSYGMNVANMAGVPRVVVERAEHIADEYEAATIARESTVLSQRVKELLA